MNSRLEIAVGSYEVWSHLRNMLLLICESLDADSSADDEPKDVIILRVQYSFYAL